MVKQSINNKGKTGSFMCKLSIVDPASIPGNQVKQIPFLPPVWKAQERARA